MFFNVVNRLFAVMEGSSDNGASAHQTNLTAKEWYHDRTRRGRSHRKF